MRILAHGPEEGAPACQFLAGWVLESTLKSFLAQQGKSKDDLKAIQHDLSGLWKLSASLGLGISALPPDWCASINSIHYGPKDNRYHSRYPTNWNGCVVPNLKILATHLEGLFSIVEKIVAPS